MNETDENKPKMPDGALLLEEGDTIQDGDLHWRPEAKHWVAITPQGEEKVPAGQYGFYCRKPGDD